MRRAINKDEVIVYEFLVPRKEKLDGNQVRLMSCGTCRLPLRVLVLFLVSLAGLSSSWLPLSLWTLLRIRGFRVFEFGNSAQQQPVCYLMSSFLYILSSSQDKMHCQLSLTVCICTPCQRASCNSTTDSFSWGPDPYTLACKARPSFDRCGTCLSVSLSLSFESGTVLSPSWTTAASSHLKCMHGHIIVATLAARFRSDRTFSNRHLDPTAQIPFIFLLLGFMQFLSPNSGSDDFPNQQARDSKTQLSTSHWTASPSLFCRPSDSHTFSRLHPTSILHRSGEMMLLSNARFCPATTRSLRNTSVLNAPFPEPAPVTKPHDFCRT